MSVVDVVKNFCECRNLNFRFIPKNEITEENNTVMSLDDTLKLTDCKYEWLWSLKYDYILHYKQKTIKLFNTQTVIEVINALKLLTIYEGSEECCVCYSECELINKCKVCSSATCTACELKILIPKNIGLVRKTLHAGMEHEMIFRLSRFFPRHCSVCKQDQRTDTEKRGFEELSRC